MIRTGSGPLAGISVLIVEDEFLIAVEAQRIVEEAGARSGALVNSIAAAHRHIAREAVDVVILDMRLGEEDGGGLLREYMDRGVPVVIASGLAPEREIAAPVLMKPYRDTDLIAAVLNALDRG